MTDTIQIEMSAEQRVRTAKIVDMKKADWDEYNRLCDDDEMSGRARDKAINAIAERYGLDSEMPHDWDDLEDTTFELVEDAK